MNSRKVPRVDGIIFDIGDILYDASVWRRWLTGELQSAGIDITYPDLVHTWEELLVDVYRGIASYWDRFDMLLGKVGIHEENVLRFRDGAREKAISVQSARVPIDGVPETLTELKSAGVKIAALSDTESGEAAVRAILRQLGIEEAFDAVVTSADIGRVKPDPEAYAAAASALELSAKQCAFVGHDIDELQGAQEAGLLAIAFNYHPDAPADVYLNDFTELLDVLFATEIDAR